MHDLDGRRLVERFLFILSQFWLCFLSHTFYTVRMLRQRSFALLLQRSLLSPLLFTF
jgi:hypothetical protein